ncbi:MAG: hypothetical protein HQK99_16535 [Nitrospirae bacterium]|nr:hypothetical protein [Nitrospirota bacterium]
MSKIKKILSEVNKHLEAAAMAEMRIDIARETLMSGGTEKVKSRQPQKAGRARHVLFDELPMMTDNEAFSNS